jgi:hypothetical protein
MGGSNPQQPPTNADTVLHVAEPPLHLEQVHCYALAVSQVVSCNAT